MALVAWLTIVNGPLKSGDTKQALQDDPVEPAKEPR
jgi:hypothetical protein